ncbi:MAG: ribonuclease III [Oscillospiraceae bacterium]|nr:ribonuclease III [Oscillospiraceae bacterium]
MNEKQLDALQEKLGYSFKNTALLTAALTHSSYANENKKGGIVSYERMEFLGDAVLGMAVSTLLYNSKSGLPEGHMTKLRSEIVCEKSLASLAKLFDLGSCIRLGRGEEKGGGRGRASILADVVEAIIAAIYLDSGFHAVTGFIVSHLMLDLDSPRRENTDYKTALQEVVQGKAGQSLSYRITDESGPDHMKSFSVEVLLNGTPIGDGTGKSKKIAEQAAAKAALDSL